jgi:hypothetical protein
MPETRFRVELSPEAEADLYEINEAAGRVDVLRFWHAHRDEPPLP